MDEPQVGRSLPPEDTEPVEEKISRLLFGCPFGVLCTQGGGIPYGSLVAFAASSDLDFLVFATPTTTRKFQLLEECENVALVVDSRPQHLAHMMRVEAVTVTGRAERTQAPEWADLLVHRHPQLAGFVGVPTCAVFRVRIVRCFYVTRFQEVYQWIPG